MRTLPSLPTLTFRLPEVNTGPYLAEARRRWERLAAVDLTRPGPWLARLSLWPGRRAEAARWRLAEAWKQTQANLQDLERQLRAHRLLPSGPRSLEALRAALFTHYCANILRYQAALGQRPGAPAQPIPVEWMQMAAATAIIAVIQTALMLWVLHRPAARAAAPRRRPASAGARRSSTPLRFIPRATPCPLRL